MPTFTKRQQAGGVRWLARVRKRGRRETRTFATLSAARVWATERERAFELGELATPRPGSGALLKDAIDAFVAHRATIGRAPGVTFANTLERLKKSYGREPLGSLDVAFWREHALARVRAGVSGSTVASELTYAGSVLRHWAREGHAVNAAAPGAARTKLREDGLRVTSRARTRRITDAEFVRLFAWIDENAHRTKLPLRDLVEFALATGMRRGEILAIQWDDVRGRVARIRRKDPRDRDRVEDVPLLKPHAQWPRVDPLAIIERQPRRGSRIFPWLGDTLGFWFERACAGAQLDEVVFHSLRHECLSRLAERGFDVLRLQLVGGHRDLRNLKRYTKLDAASLADAEA